MQKYDPASIEPKWQRFWEEKKLYQAVDFDKRPKSYLLIEFPYPSGERLHVGHGRSYCAIDALARKRRMEGFNVLFPIGWDAFGLPAENFAIKTGIHPSVTVAQNIENAKKQAKSWGLSFDWSREINTTDPSYYKWTQWIFIQLFKHGLAYKAEIPINFCPSCKIGLANEEVVEKSKILKVCERCGTEVTERKLNQWMLKITAYAERLLKDLDLVDYSPAIKEQQVNWIGKKEGVGIKFSMEPGSHLGGRASHLTVFTTRPETLFGVTFLAISPPPNHPSEGGVFTGSFALHPLTGEQIPIWIADYVLETVGTGVVMGVPAHDSRDYEFARRFGLPIKVVVVPDENSKFKTQNSKLQFKIKNEWKEGVYEDEGVLINSGEFSGLSSLEAHRKIAETLEKQGRSRFVVTFHLRDWIFSRQHYWGEPIPMVYCESCAKRGVTWWDAQPGSHPDGSAAGGIPQQAGSQGATLNRDFKKSLVGWFPVPEDQLPVELPHVDRYQPTETGQSPLAVITNWVKTVCPNCGEPASRETDTMPNWAGSSWYFLRYCDPLNHSMIASPKKLKYWLPIDLYNGGMEHTTLHLLYSRFWHKFLYDLDVVPSPEPYAKRRSHGVVLGPDGQKMSKSRGNVVNPDEVIQKYGADTFRVYEMFMGPFSEMIAWDEKAIVGVHRFLERVWNLVSRSLLPGPAVGGTPPQAAREGATFNKEESGMPLVEASRGAILNKSDSLLVSKLHCLIKKVGEDLENLKFNTAVAALMEFLNDWSKEPSLLSIGDTGVYLQLLAPFAPHLTEELWQIVKVKNVQLSESIHQTPWPKYDPALIKAEKATVVVQVDGKIRDKLEIESNEAVSQEKVISLAQKSPRIQKAMMGKTLVDTIFVPGRLLNFVTKVSR